MSLRPAAVAALLLVVIIVIVVGIVAIPLLRRTPERGATLTISVINGMGSLHIVQVTAKDVANGTKVGFEVASVLPGDTGTITLTMGPQLNDRPLQIEFFDETTDYYSTQTWTPRAGASDTMDYVCQAA